MEISIIPRFLIKKLTDNDIQQINWNILMSTILILILLIFIKISLINSIPHFCLFNKLTGFPCPVCGITRSFLSLYDFKIMESLKYNPNGLIISSFFILQIPMRIIVLFNENHFYLIEKISRIMSRLIITTLLIYWIFQIINIKF